jgi:hypothetical protein
MTIDHFVKSRTDGLYGFVSGDMGHALVRNSSGVAKWVETHSAASKFQKHVMPCRVNATPLRTCNLNDPDEWLPVRVNRWWLRPPRCRSCHLALKSKPRVLAVCYPLFCVLWLSGRPQEGFQTTRAPCGLWTSGSSVRTHEVSEWNYEIMQKAYSSNW